MYKCKICGTLSSKYTEVCSRCNGTEIEQIPDNTYVGNSIRYNSPEYNIYVPSMPRTILIIPSTLPATEGFEGTIVPV